MSKQGQFETSARSPSSIWSTAVPRAPMAYVPQTRRIRSSDPAVRQAREAELARGRIAQMKSMIADLSKLIQWLDAEIELEQNRTRVSDPRNVAYSTRAHAMRDRRDNLQRTVADLERQCVEARSSLPKPGEA